MSVDRTLSIIVVSILASCGSDADVEGSRTPDDISSPDGGASSSDDGASPDDGGVSPDGGASTDGGVQAPAPLGVDGTWALVFDDEFDGTSLDTTKWDPHWFDEGGKINDVGTYAENVSVSGGNLLLTLASASSGACVNTQSHGGFAVQVGMYAEARVSFAGDGDKLYNWPAWWISGAPWPTAGEHDVAEVLGGQLTVNYHSPSGAHNQGAVEGTWANAFHVYGVHRKASSADVYWDGKLVKSYATDDSGDGQNLIFNIGRDTSAHATTVYGAGSQLKVDYVRVWE